MTYSRPGNANGGVDVPVIRYPPHGSASESRPSADPSGVLSWAAFAFPDKAPSWDFWMKLISLVGPSKLIWRESMLL
jgi:hypothetical protein